MLEIGDEQRNGKVVSEIQNVFELKSRGKESCRISVMYLGEMGNKNGHSAQRTELIAMETHHRIISSGSADPYAMDDDDAGIPGTEEQDLANDNDL